VAIVLEASDQAVDTASSAGPLATPNITPAGSNRLVIVWVAAFGNVTVSAITYGGTDISGNVIKFADHDGLDRKVLGGYYLIAPATSAAAASITWSAASIDRAIIVQAWSGVDQGTPYSNLAATADGAGQSADPSSQDITTTSDGVGTDVYYAWSGGLGQTATPTQTTIEEVENAGTNGFVVGTSYAAGTGSAVTFSWDASGTPTYAWYGINLNAAAGAAAASARRWRMGMLGVQ
jgi:hypothetical protein